ncbi:SDR family NAD(P)-dependent oxidoreductase [Azohydromonas sediminis]|uniref:SDR family NAD(P)-dependent oxidoreductase n=1 Tax=Azohydromonas sediminis TaxID=2259674 RepID=UPI000E646E7E|nr:SDR family NAD(P)-dependent oxidoreductase [Azohydromonas sediminis]
MTAASTPPGIALVTGASAGFGTAIVRRLHADGWRVVACARRADRLAALATELGERVLAWPLDVTDRTAVEALPTALPDGFAAVDLLVNNAGLALGLEPAHRASLDDWETMVATNVAGLMRCTRALLPGMVERGRGHVINIGSVAGGTPYPGGNVYGATKAFVHQFTRNLKADLLGTPVRATVIEPGLVGGSEFSNVRFKGDDARAASVYAGTEPLVPEDIAEAVAWVARLPPHVNINVIEMMPACQAHGPLAIHRKG